jgi:transcriptional regulator GlxA family with amidase domain
MRPVSKRRLQLHVSERSCRVCSVCTGIFCLAEAGLLGERHVTTHWQYAADSLARKYPALLLAVAQKKNGTFPNWFP